MSARISITLMTILNVFAVILKTVRQLRELMYSMFCPGLSQPSCGQRHGGDGDTEETK